MKKLRVELLLIDVRKIFLLIAAITLSRVASDLFLLQQQRDGTEIVVAGRVIENYSPSSQKTDLKIGNYFVQLDGGEAIKAGNVVSIRGLLTCYDSFRCSRGSIKDSILLSQNADSWSWLFFSAANLRTNFQKTYFSNLRRDQANLLSGIVLGGGDLDRNFKQKITQVGLNHIVAASGMNVTLVVGLALGLLTLFPLNRRNLILVATIIVLVYLFVAALSPAVVRAGIMGLAVLWGGFWGRKTNPFYSLFLAGVLMLWASPLLLLDYGFLLSFASMMGQVTLSTLKFNLPKALALVVEIVMQNLLAIVFTLPIVMFGFHSFSLISLLSNLLVVWTVEPLMVSGLMAGILNWTFPEMSHLLLQPAGILLNYFLWVVKTLSNEKFLFKYESFNLAMATGYYLMLSSMVYLIKRHQKTLD